MNYYRVLVCIFIMASITYIIRMLPLTFFRKKIENSYIKSFLSYVPYAVLGAMTFPDIFYSTADVFSALCGLIMAFFLAYKEKSLIIVAGSACAVVFIVERIQGFI